MCLGKSLFSDGFGGSSSDTGAFRIQAVVRGSEEVGKVWHTGGGFRF